MQNKVQLNSERYLIHFRVLTPIVYTSTQGSGVLLTMRYMVQCRHRRGSSGEMWEEILRRFAPHKDIDFAYPTVRRYNEQAEGKRATKGAPQSSLEPMTQTEPTVQETTKDKST